MKMIKTLIVMFVVIAVTFLYMYNYTKGVYREEGMQLTMTVRTQQTLYQRPDMLKIESSIRT